MGVTGLLELHLVGIITEQYFVRDVGNKIFNIYHKEQCLERTPTAKDSRFEKNHNTANPLTKDEVG